MFKTKVGWIIICLILVVVFGTLANWFDWCKWVMFASLSYPIILSLIMFYYAIKNSFKND